MGEGGAVKWSWMWGKKMWTGEEALRCGEDRAVPIRLELRATRQGRKRKNVPWDSSCRAKGDARILMMTAEGGLLMLVSEFVDAGS